MSTATTVRDPNVRTEDDIISCAPIKIRFGDRDYDVKVLRILAARKWREQFVETMQRFMVTFNAPAAESADAGQKQFASALTTALVQFPEEVATLVLSYDTTLPKEAILENATDEQLASAFSRIMSVAFPFLRQLTQVTSVLNAMRK